jgi:hypothetical protein
MNRSVIVGVCLLAGCASRHGAQPAQLSSSPPSPTASPFPQVHIASRGSASQPVRIVEQSKNRKVYELLARSSDSTMQSQTSSKGIFRQTRVTFYGADGSTLSGAAPMATIDTAAETITLQNGVRAKTSDGITLQCDQLEYDRSTGQLHGTGNVRVVNRAGYALTGGSFRSDLRLSHVHVE